MAARPVFSQDAIRGRAYQADQVVKQDAADQDFCTVGAQANAETPQTWLSRATASDRTANWWVPDVASLPDPRPQTEQESYRGVPKGGVDGREFARCTQRQRV